MLPRWETFVLEFQKNVFEVAFEVIICPYFYLFLSITKSLEKEMFLNFNCIGFKIIYATPKRNQSNCEFINKGQTNQLHVEL